ncbi:MAG: pilus assembly protein CpaB [Solirubrobacteraceae bacterium]|nr:pilus assembly protein CpaB [Solirubrobacteraceae bacterium]
MMSRRRRALLLGGLALVLGGLAASNVAGREAALSRRVGNLVDVVVARERIAAGRVVRPAALAVRRVPARFAPEERVASPSELTGQKAAVDIDPGTDMTARLVGAADGGPAGLAIGRGERVAQVVALGSPQLIAAGSRVDVLVTPEPRSDERGEAMLALEDVEVLDAAPIAAADAPPARGEAPAGERVAASLRVTLRQAVYLAAAQDFARELRLLPRAAGDRSRGSAGLRIGALAP